MSRRSRRRPGAVAASMIGQARARARARATAWRRRRDGREHGRRPGLDGRRAGPDRAGPRARASITIGPGGRR
eukprot:3948540-Pyramimonas_sp.AAC.1